MEREISSLQSEVSRNAQLEDETRRKFEFLQSQTSTFHVDVAAMHQKLAVLSGKVDFMNSIRKASGEVFSTLSQSSRTVPVQPEPPIYVAV